MWSWCFEKVSINDPVYIASGRYKNRFGVVIEKTITQLRIILRDTGREVLIIYPNVEEVREGKPIESPMFDMTGRKMKIGDLVACVGTPKRTMDICRIVGGEHVRGVTVQTIVRNGEKLPPNMWTFNQRDIVNPLKETIKLPIDEATVVMWKLKDYDFV